MGPSSKPHRVWGGGKVLRRAHELLQVQRWVWKMKFKKNLHLFSIYFFDLPCWKNKLGSTIS